MSIILSIIACLASLIAMILMVLKKSRAYAIAIIFSSIGIITGFIALALKSPRDEVQMGFDYLGFIVAILAIIATLLLGMQLYHVFRLKDDADEVQKAKQRIDEYTASIEDLTRKTNTLSETLAKLSEKTKSLDEDIKPLYDSVSDIQNKLESAVFVVHDGPCDDK